MTGLAGRRGAMVVAVALTALMTAGVAGAQVGTVKPNAASNNNVQGAGSGSGGGSPNTVVDPSNGGVAGTGLGKTTADPHGPGAGTGNSVKGPAGQGISNSTDTGQ